MFNKLWWKTTLFELNSPKDIPQNSKQHNGSSVVEVWKHEGMGGIYELGHTKSHMRWESFPSTHPLHGCLIYLSHCITYTNPGKPNTVHILGHLRSGAGAALFHKTRHLLQPWFSAAHILARAYCPHFHPKYNPEIVKAVGHGPNMQT